MAAKDGATMTDERAYELDMAAKLATELQDRYRLPGETWGLVFDEDGDVEDGDLTDEEAYLRIRGMLDDADGRKGIESFLEETVDGFITDASAESDWRIARAALTLLRGREGDPQPPLARNGGVGDVRQAFEAYKRCGGWRGLDAEDAIRTFVEFCSSEIPEGRTVLRRVGGNALVFVREHAHEPYVLAYGYDEWRGKWAGERRYSDASEAWDDIDPDIISGSTIKWRRSDFARALAERGHAVDDELIDEAIERTMDMGGWRELALRHGNEHVSEILADLLK